MTARTFEICIDSNDPDLLRPFWRTALRYVDYTQPDGAVDLVDPDGHGPAIWFQRVPETKTIKNRVHLDVWVLAPDRDAATAELTALGGTVLRTEPTFTVLADPEGNELCLSDLAPPTPSTR